MTSPTPDQERRLAAKRNNERVKLLANAVNAAALAVLGAAFIIPAVNNPASLLAPGPWLLLLLAVAIHASAHAVFGLFRSEE